MNVNGKYIKDENGDVISPITSINTIYNDTNTLKSCITLEKLFIAGGSTDTITKTITASNYKWFVGNLAYNATTKTTRILSSIMFSYDDLVKCDSNNAIMLVYGGDSTTFAANIWYNNSTSICIRMNQASYGGVILYGIRGL